MRIAIVNTWAISKKAVGGTERFVMDLAKSFVDSGNEVDVFMFSGNTHKEDGVNYINIDLFKALIIIYTNFLIMIFNLLPIYPLDGGRILKGILHINFGIQKSEFYTNIISKITVTIITILSSVLILYIHNIAIALIDMYLWYLVIKEDIIYKKREKILENINKKTLENETNS